MTVSRRNLLLSGAALGLLAPALIGCNDQGVVVDNATGGNTTGSGGASANATGGTGAGGNTTDTGGNTTGGGAAAGPMIRYDVATPQGQAMLAIYAKAVALMMAKPDGDPTSWKFQWYSHWVGGATDHVAKTSEIVRVYGSAPSPQRNLAELMWDGCQAHDAGEDEDFFLPWHRMYVMAFEAIVRSVADEPSFTLPYWNYLDPAQHAIPAQFRRQGDATWGALYSPNRNGAVNAGSAIASSTVLSASVLSEATYSSSGFDDGFCASLDNGLHGAVHVGVGNGINGMGAIPWAANDPIFWLHHCNIDRMWASWNAAGGANPTDPQFTSKPFVFADTNGQQTSKVVSTVLDLASAGYAYDALVGADGTPLTTRTEEERIVAAPAPVAAAAPPSVGASAPRMVMRSAPIHLAPTVTHVMQNVQLGAGLVRVHLANAAAVPAAAAAALAPALKIAPRMLKRPLAIPGHPAPPMVMSAAPPPKAAVAATPLIPAPKPGQKVFVVLDDLTTEIQPGVIYSIYLEAPTGSGAPQPYLIGSLNFFSAMPAMGGMKMGHRARSFDITALATQLANQGRLQANPSITFVPVGRPAASAAPLIGSISVAIQ